MEECIPFRWEESPPTDETRVEQIVLVLLDQIICKRQYILRVDVCILVIYIFFFIHNRAVTK